MKKEVRKEVTYQASSGCFMVETDGDNKVIGITFIQRGSHSYNFGILQFPSIDEFRTFQKDVTEFVENVDIKEVNESR